ncbi:MAG TPA: thioredoxin-like domain-containing protein, partial [Candidatus Binatia bacterium]
MLPQLRQLAERFPDLAIIGVHCGKYPNERRDAQLRAALERLEVAHPVVNDRTYRAWRAFGIFGWPTLVLLDPDGRVAHTKVGESTAEYWTPLLEQHIRAGTEAAGHPPVHAPRQMQRAVRFPEGIAVRPGLVALADTGNHRLLVGKLEADVLQITQIIGSGEPGYADGPAEEAAFNQPRGLAFAGDLLYVADTANHRVRAVNISTGAVTTVL